MIGGTIYTNIDITHKNIIQFSIALKEQTKLI